jgi:hypothetical protein
MASKLASRSTERGISNGGEPSRPTPERTGPSSGIIAFVATRMFSPIRAPVGKVIELPTNEFVPTITGLTRNEELVNSALPKETSSEIWVPPPTLVRNGSSCCSDEPKLEPVCPPERASR